MAGWAGLVDGADWAKRPSGERGAAFAFLFVFLFLYLFYFFFSFSLVSFYFCFRKIPKWHLI